MLTGVLIVASQPGVASGASRVINASTLPIYCDSQHGRRRRRQNRSSERFLHGESQSSDAKVPERYNLALYCVLYLSTYRRNILANLFIGEV